MRKQPMHKIKRRAHVSHLVAGWFVRSLWRLEAEELRSLRIGMEGALITDNIQAGKLLALRREMTKRIEGSYEY